MKKSLATVPSVRPPPPQCNTFKETNEDNAWPGAVTRALARIEMEVSTSISLYRQAANYIVENLEKFGLSRNLRTTFTSSKALTIEDFLKIHKKEFSWDVARFQKIREIFEKIIFNEFSKIKGEKVEVENGVRNPFEIRPLVEKQGRYFYNAPFDGNFYFLIHENCKNESLRRLFVQHWDLSKGILFNRHLLPIRLLIREMHEFNLPVDFNSLATLQSRVGGDFLRNSFAVKNYGAAFLEHFNEIFRREIVERKKQGFISRKKSPIVFDLPFEHYGSLTSIPREKDFFWLEKHSLKCAELRRVICSYESKTRKRRSSNEGLDYVGKINSVLKALILCKSNLDPNHLVSSGRIIEYVSISNVGKEHGFDVCEHDYNLVSDIFEQYVLAEFSSIDELGYVRFNAGVINPFPRTNQKQHVQNDDFKYVLDYNVNYQEWLKVLFEFNKVTKSTDNSSYRIGFIRELFCEIMPKYQVRVDMQSVLFSGEVDVAVTDYFKRSSYSSQYQKICKRTIYRFFELVLNLNYQSLGLKKTDVPFVEIRFDRGTYRSRDWHIDNVGEKIPEMYSWSSLAVKFMKGRRLTNLSSTKSHLHYLFEHFIGARIFDPIDYVTRKSYDREFEIFLENHRSHVSPHTLKDQLVEMVRFIDFVREVSFEVDEDAIGTLYGFNPLLKFANDLSHHKDPRTTESNKSAMPMWLVQSLKNFLFPPDASNYSELKDCIQAFDGDWVEVPEELIDKKDVDCVWRHATRARTGEVVLEIWNPVCATLALLHLMTPLRNVQIRALDSGETDTYKYVHNGVAGWFEPNQSKLARGDLKRPVKRGAFYLDSPTSLKEDCHSLYINTNKTADIDKSADDRGYVMPIFNAPRVLHWLAKLRNWQEKYNPIQGPTKWQDVCEPRYFGSLNPEVVKHRNPVAFLFRSLGNGRGSVHFPITRSVVVTRWKGMLRYAEMEFKLRGIRAEDGSRIQLTEDRANEDTPKVSKKVLYRSDFVPLYTLHGMRVSMITFLILDLGVPLEIVSKMIAGHAHVLMTLHYTKLKTAHVREVLSEAERRWVEATQQNALKNARQKSLDDLRAEFACLESDFRSALEIAAGSSGLGYIVTDVGICPNGGTRCEEGGRNLTPERVAHIQWGPVPGFPRRNCVRCRFNLTSFAFINGLKFRFNEASFKVSELQPKLIEVIETIERLDAKGFEAANLNIPFAEKARLARNREREEELTNEISEALSDMNACHHMIQTVLNLEESKKTKNQTQLVTVGEMHELKIGLAETKSKAYCLSAICQDAEIYHTPEVGGLSLKQGQLIDKMLDLNNMRPVMFKLSPEMQLKAGNDFIRLMTKHMPNQRFAEVVSVLEGYVKLSELGIEKQVHDDLAQLFYGVHTSQEIKSSSSVTLALGIENEQS